MNEKNQNHIQKFINIIYIIEIKINILKIINYLYKLKIYIIYFIYPIHQISTRELLDLILIHLIHLYFALSLINYFSIIINIIINIFQIAPSNP